MIIVSDFLLQPSSYICIFDLKAIFGDVVVIRLQLVSLSSTLQEPEPGFRLAQFFVTLVPKGFRLAEHVEVVFEAAASVGVIARTELVGHLFVGG